MRKLLIVLPVLSVMLSAFLITRSVVSGSSASFDLVVLSLEYLSLDLPSAGSQTGSGGPTSKQTVLDLINPARWKTPNRHWTSEIESHRTKERVIVLIEGRENRVWRIVIDPTADPLLAAEIESYLLKRHPSLRPLLSIMPPKP